MFETYLVFSYYLGQRENQKKEKRKKREEKLCNLSEVDGEDSDGERNQLS